MMSKPKTPEMFRQQQAAREKWEKEREQQIQQMEMEKSNLEKKLDDAINADDPVQTEKLMKQIADMTGKIEALQLILDTKKKQPAVTLEELAEAQHAAMDEYDAKLAASVAALEKAKRAFYDAYTQTAYLRSEAIDRGVWAYAYILDINVSSDKRFRELRIPRELPRWNVDVFLDEPYCPYNRFELFAAQNALTGILPKK